MDVTFDQEDGNAPLHWTFDPDDVLRSEAAAIEKAFGGPWEQFINQLRVKDAKARTVLIWHLLRQQHPNLRFDDVPDFRMRQVKVQMSSTELRDLYDLMVRQIKDEDIKEAFQTAWNADYQDALLREGKAIEGEIESGPKGS